MRAVMLEVPDDLLEERRRSGADRRDEMWDGVLHMAPAPGIPHQVFVARFVAATLPRAEARGLVCVYQPELYRPNVGRRDYRIPDVIFSRPGSFTERGVQGGGRVELAVEVLSRHDETYKKLGFYAEMGVQELLVVRPVTCEAEMFVLRDGALVPGPSYSAALDVTFATVVTPAGPVLRITWPGGSADVHARA